MEKKMKSETPRIRLMNRGKKFVRTGYQLLGQVITTGTAIDPRQRVRHSANKPFIARLWRRTLALSLTLAVVVGCTAGAWAYTQKTTDVVMVSLKAIRYEDRVLLEWQTSYELNN